jgi:hypothetical protein
MPPHGPAPRLPLRNPWQPVVCKTGASGCLAFVVVDDAAEDIPALDVAVGWPSDVRHRTALLQSLMRAAAVEERNVGAQHPVEMPLIQDNQAVQALLAGRADPSLRVCVRIR